ncbi:P22AR C-terminal domain-containing protein [Serratia nevei]|uniref:P22AR C-terminal domain-containing protein n=1 Tax=Serratia nevei TaxID=2703794 RepID=UPI003F6AEB27
MDSMQHENHRNVMNILGISSISDLDIVVGYLVSMLKPESQEYKSQRERLSKIITNQDTTRTTQFTDEELCHLCWLWKYSARMIGYIADIAPLLRVAEHKLYGAYAGMAHEYPRHINEARLILERETIHIECSQFRSDNWRVLRQMRINHPSCNEKNPPEH